MDTSPLMRTSATGQPAIGPYRVLPFPSRSAAVRYCHHVSDALESSALAGDSGAGGATLWLAATCAPGGAVDVYASEAAFQAAGGEALVGQTPGYAGEDDLPAARCLILGEERLVQQ